MTMFERKTIISLTLAAAAAGYSCTQSETAEPALPDHFTGTATFDCEGHRYKAKDLTIIETSREDLRDSTLTLALTDGKITDWQSRPTTSIPSRAIGTMEKISEFHCADHKDECTADYGDSENNRIYLYKAAYIHADTGYIDMSAGAISKDFRFMTTLDTGHMVNEQPTTYSTGYSCKLKDYQPRNTPS